MSKNVCRYCYLLLFWLMLSGPLAINAEEASPQPSKGLTPPGSMSDTAFPGSDDFARRLIASYLLLQNTVKLMTTVSRGLESDQQKALLLKPLELLQEDLLVRLVLAKYLTRQEMDTLIEFLDTAEIVSILTKINQYLMFPQKIVQQDMENFVQEIKAIYSMTIVNGWLGKTTEEDSASFAFPTKTIETQPFVEDKIEIRDRLTAAGQFVESCLPLIEGTFIRMLNRQVKEEDMEIEGSRISLAVRSMMDNLREDPILVLVLARHFDAKELNMVTRFLSKEEIRLGVDRLSRMWVSPQGGKLKYDLGRVRQEFSNAFTGVFGNATATTSTQNAEMSKKAKGESGKTETAKPKVRKTEGSTAIVPTKKGESQESPPPPGKTK